MGATNVTLVYAHWTRLDGAPFRVLIYMALVSLDADDPPRYFGGWEALANALGRQLPPKDDPGQKAQRERAAAAEAVRVAVRQLTRAGAVSTLRPAGAGHRAEYALHLPAPEPQGEPAPEPQGEPAPEPQGEPAPKEQQRNHRGIQRGEDHLGGNVTCPPGMLRSYLQGRPGVS
jgi:hypothetical protein